MDRSIKSDTFDIQMRRQLNKYGEKNMTTSINIQASRINILSQLLKFEGQTNQQPILYKKTAISFRKRFGIDLKDAPIIFVKHGCMWKLSHITYKSQGRTYESADYLPIVGCADKFQRLSSDIKTIWDKR